MIGLLLLYLELKVWGPRRRSRAHYIAEWSRMAPAWAIALMQSTHAGTPPWR